MYVSYIVISYGYGTQINENTLWILSNREWHTRNLLTCVHLDFNLLFSRNLFSGCSRMDNFLSDIYIYIYIYIYI